MIKQRADADHHQVFARREDLLGKFRDNSATGGFDLPAVGPGTVAALAQVQGRALAVESGRTIILDRDEMILGADRADIAVVAVDGAGVDGRC